MYGIRMMKSKRMKCAVRVARMGEKRNAYRILVGNPERKRPLGRPRRRRVDNIKINVREIDFLLRTRKETAERYC
jgi:hypothetical protein